MADDKKDKAKVKANSTNVTYCADTDVVYCADISEGATPYPSFCRRRGVRIVGIPDTSAVKMKHTSSCNESCNKSFSDSLLDLMPSGSSRS